MPLRDEDIQRIGNYIKPWIRELVGTVVLHPAAAGIDSQLLERMVRVEEELKAQRELMVVKFDAVDRRFELMDKRFHDLIGQSNNRFDDLIGQSNVRFEGLVGQIDRRFESVDKRFNTLTWMIGVGFAVITSLTTVFALLA